MKKLAVVVLAALSLIACSSVESTSGPREMPSPERITEMYESLPDKYKVPGLEPLARVTEFNINGWTSIDRRSLIIEAGASRRYLVVLRNNSSELRFAKSIVVDRDSSVIRVGFDRIFVVGDTIRMPYYIQAMFELDGREGANAAREYIRNYDDNQVEEDAESPEAES